jgi:hypothetical protein
MHTHRGASLEVPENTLEAFGLAIELGADAVHLTREQVPRAALFRHGQEPEAVHVFPAPLRAFTPGVCSRRACVPDPFAAAEEIRPGMVTRRSASSESSP